VIVTAHTLYRQKRLADREEVNDRGLARNEAGSVATAGGSSVFIRPLRVGGLIESINHTETKPRVYIMENVQVVSSVTGQYWQITVNGVVVEGFAKRGHGAAKKYQVEAIAQTYREQV
jgi:hypothetical protein